MAQTDTDAVQFARYNQAGGIKDRPRLGLDTNLGLQAGYRINDDLAATVQVLTRKNTSPQFTTELTWAFLTWKASDSVRVRAGRVVMPVFLISDYQNVGYANTMMRPPIEMYGQIPVEGIDGGDVVWQGTVGATNVTLQGYAGVSQGKLFIPTGETVAKYRAPSMGLSFVAERGPVQLRLSHLRTKPGSDEVTPLNTLSAALTAVGFVQLGKDLGLVGGKKFNFTSVGLTMDWNNVVLQSEYGMRRAKEPVYVADTNAWYLMAGYRFGKVLPYYAHAAYHGAGQSLTVPASLANVPPLAEAVSSVLQAPAQTSNLVGVRWGFSQSAALKLQMDRVQPRQSSGSLIFPPTGGQKASVNVFAAAVDFVF